VKQRHVFYELAKNRLVNRLIRIAGSYRLGNISMATALSQSEVALRKVMEEVNRYTVEVLGARYLGGQFKPLSPEALVQLEEDVEVKQREFKAILRDVK